MIFYLETQIALLSRNWPGDILSPVNPEPSVKMVVNKMLVKIIAITAITFLDLLDTIQDQNIRKAGGDGHAALSYISDDIFDEIKDNELIDRISYTKSVSYRLHNAGLEWCPADQNPA